MQTLKFYINASGDDDDYDDLGLYLKSFSSHLKIDASPNIPLWRNFISYYSLIFGYYEVVLIKRR